MYSSEDLERFYVEYQSEWVPRGMTMRAYCDRNNVPYRVMENFVSNIRKKIVEVEVTGCPPETESAKPTTDATTGPEKPTHRIPQEQPVYRMDWKDLVLLLESPVRKKLRLR